MQTWPSAVPPHETRSRVDGRIVAGAALLFVGFLLGGIGELSYLFNYGYGNPFRFLLVGIGSILAAIGFLIAFLGLAFRRAG